MVLHIQSKEEDRNVTIFIHLLMHIFGVLYGQYGHDTLAWLLEQYCIILTHALIDELRGVSNTVWIFGSYATSQIIEGRVQKCARFHLSTHCTSSECCVASMEVIPLFGYLYNDHISTSAMYSLSN